MREGMRGKLNLNENKISDNRAELLGVIIQGNSTINAYTCQTMIIGDRCMHVYFSTLCQIAVFHCYGCIVLLTLLSMRTLHS